MIEIFYKCINEKNLKEMSTCISEDCLIEDSLFIEKFKGKKAAMSFIEKLTESMGPDVKFRIRTVYERRPSMAGAIWHLGYNETCDFIACKASSNLGMVDKSFSTTLGKEDIKDLYISLQTSLGQLFEELSNLHTSWDSTM
ncbi:uncharacterized protein E6C27_scaffold44G002310 [Cucumis melo var. makuwa]|uniref:Uncharacterized protein n=1 Tax=Cucumis melo var. makuwa TaxID=1194695 RepID=A0A5A7TH50_CUCMM|nr:uncharacterized protein E6C27_scaffold44G002310 [Cucumis melo var. makuwa]